MEKAEAWAHAIALAVAAMVLGGCGVKITATHVPTELSRLNQEGIYYALPRTQVSITVPVVLERFDKGRLGEVFGPCLKACSTTPPASAAPKECNLPPAATLRFLRPEVATRGVPDRDHIYRVTVEAETFASAKHKMTLNELGILTSTESSASDTSFEVVGGVVGAVSGVLAKAILINLNLDLEPVPPATAADSVPCATVTGIKQQLDKFKSDIGDVQKEITTFLASPREAKYAALFIADAKERIARIEAQAAQYRVGADLEEAKTVFRYRLEAAQPLDPDELEVHQDRLLFKTQAPLDEAQAKAPDIHKVLEDGGYEIWAVLTHDQKVEKCSSPACRLPSVGGFRYRLPRMGALRVELYQNTTQETTPLLSGLVPIAQYGPIAALPSRFEGKGGSVELAASDVTGGLSKVAIGSDAVPAAAVTAPLESIGGVITARREGKEKKAQAERDAQKNELQREKDLLQLQKEIRDLKKDLGG